MMIIASKDLSPRILKPDLNSELKHPDGLNGRQLFNLGTPSRLRGMSIVYLPTCLWIKYITRVKILGLGKDEANQKCAPWALLAQDVLVKGP